MPIRDKLMLDVPKSKSKKKTIKPAATRNKSLLWQQGIQRVFSVMCSLQGSQQERPGKLRKSVHKESEPDGENTCGLGNAPGASVGTPRMERICANTPAIPR